MRAEGSSTFFNNICAVGVATLKSKGDVTVLERVQVQAKIVARTKHVKSRRFSKRLAAGTMKKSTNALVRNDRVRCGRAFLVALFVLYISCVMVLEAPKSILGAGAPVQAELSTPEVAKFTDVTSSLGISFDYVASHTSKKYGT